MQGKSKNLKLVFVLMLIIAARLAFNLQALTRFCYLGPTTTQVTMNTCRCHQHIYHKLQLMACGGKRVDGDNGLLFQKLRQRLNDGIRCRQRLIHAVCCMSGILCLTKVEIWKKQI